MSKDKRLVDAPTADRPPSLRRRIARADCSLRARRSVVRQPELRRGQVHPSGDRCKACMIARVSDPRLIADQLVRQVHLPDFGERKRRAYIGSRFDIAERRLIDRAKLQAEPLERQHPVECLGIARCRLEPRFDPFGVSRRHIGARGPEVPRRDHFLIARPGGNRGEGFASGLPVLLAPRGEPGNPIGLSGPIAIASARNAREAASGHIIAGQIVGPSNPLLPFGQRIRIEPDAHFIENAFRLVRAVAFQERNEASGKSARPCRRSGHLAAARCGAQPA